MAEATGLVSATSYVTGTRSSQVNYTRFLTWRLRLFSLILSFRPKIALRASCDHCYRAQLSPPPESESSAVRPLAGQGRFVESTISSFGFTEDI